MSKWTKQKKADYKLSEESAEAAVRELIDFYGVGVSDEESADEKEAKSRRVLIENFDKLQEYYREGKIENKPDEVTGFSIVQHTAGGSNIVYRELRPKDKTVLDGFSENQIYVRVNALMGRLCGHGEDVITKLKNEDYRVAEALAIVFFLA
jgi:hypothetical protein